MARFETWYSADLKHVPQMQVIHGNVFTQDNMGNRVGVTVRDNGADAVLSGGVVGYIQRADGNTVTVTGSLKDNRAWIDLPEAAYAIPGQITIVLRLVDGETKTVLCACTAYVQRSATGSIIDPGHVVPSLEDLLAQISAMEAATDATQEATANANTATENADDAAARANAAAVKIEYMQAQANTVPGGSGSAVAVSEVDGHYKLTFNIPAGITPTLTIGTVAAVEPDEPPRVTITGTVTDPVLNMFLPKGEKGDTGEVAAAEIREGITEAKAAAAAVNEALSSGVLVDEDGYFYVNTED